MESQPEVGHGAVTIVHVGDDGTGEIEFEMLPAIVPGRINIEQNATNTDRLRIRADPTETVAGFVLGVGKRDEQGSVIRGRADLIVVERERQSMGAEVVG